MKFCRVIYKAVAYLQVNDHQRPLVTYRICSTSGAKPGRNVRSCSIRAR